MDLTGDEADEDSKMPAVSTPASIAQLFQEFTTITAPKIAPFYNIPEADYCYKKDEAGIPSTDPYFKRYQDLTAACQQTDRNPDKTPLAVHEHLVRYATALTAELMEISTAFDKQKQIIQHREAKPSKPHKSTLTKMVFTRPQTAHQFPQLQSIYDQLDSDMLAMNQVNHILGTKLILQGQKIQVFQLRLERVNKLFHALIDQLGPLHVTYYRSLMSLSQPQPPDYHPKSTRELSIRATQTLIRRADGELLQYLDFNKKGLIEYFRSQYKNPRGILTDDLSPLDRISLANPYRRGGRGGRGIRHFAAKAPSKLVDNTHQSGIPELADRCDTDSETEPMDEDVDLPQDDTDGVDAFTSLSHLIDSAAKV